MSSNQLSRTWFGECSDQTEAAFREKLRQLTAGGVRNEDISKAVINDPFILGLIRLESSKGFFAKNPELRDAWRTETLILIGQACLKRGMLDCDLDRPNIGGFWRTVVRRKAINARRAIHKELEFGPRNGVYHLSDKSGIDDLAEPQHGPTGHAESLEDLRLDLRMAVSRIEDTRVRLVMTKLLSTAYTYTEMAEELGLTVNQVRYDVERGKAILQEALQDLRD